MNAKRIIFSLSLLTILVLILFNSSCRHDPVGIDKFEAVCFDTQIQPILQSSCGMSGCHGSGGEAGGFSPTSYQSIMQTVQAGSAAKSKLYQVITDVNGGNLMPPNQPLTKEQRTLIMIWIEQGAHDVCSTAGGEVYPSLDSVCFVQSVEPIFQSNCGKVGCHDLNSSNADFVLTNYATIMQSADGIVPFVPNSGKIYWSITTNSGYRMPPNPNPALTSYQTAEIRKWIADGALNSDCPSQTCDTTGIISYLNGVKSLIQNNCIGCHNSSVSNGSVNLSNYAQLKHYSETLLNGTPIIVGALRYRSGFKGMPPSGILNICQIRTVELWISQGMLDN